MNLLKIKIGLRNYYVFQLDVEEFIINIFLWTGARMIIDYSHFNDKIMLDTISQRKDTFDQGWCPLQTLSPHQGFVVANTIQ